MAVSISLSVTQNSQSTANNTSNVTVKVNYSWTYGSYNLESSTKYVKINGTKYSFNDAKINPNATTSGSGTLYTKTLNVSHNADGTGEVEVYAYVDTDISSGVLTKSTTKTLDTIPRASTITATSAVVGSQSTITISRKSSSFTHTLSYSFGSLTGTIATKTSSTSVKWTLPTTFYAQIGATATSKSGTITCKTYKGDDLIGTKTASFTAKTSSATCAPTLSPTVVADATTQGLTGDTTTLIKYISTAAITFGAAARNSATLKSKKATNSGKSRTTDGNFTAITSGVFNFTATDSRGYSTSKEITVDVVPYVKLSCSLKASMTVDGVMTIKASGNYFNGSFGAAANTLTVQYRFKESGGSYSAWTDISNSKSGSTYSATQTITGLDYTKTYTVQTRATDKITTVTPSAKNVKALPVFDWGEEDFNHYTRVFIPNGKAVASYKTTGEEVNMCWTTTNNNLMIGGGNYMPPNIYLKADSGGDIKVGNDDTDWYSVLGACKALTTTYSLSCSTTLGANYSTATAYASLVGNCLRLNINATRKSAVNTGNITNETVMTIRVNHNGKIDNLYNTSFNTGTTGGVATFITTNEKIDDNNFDITVTMTASAYEGTQWSASWIMPANLRLSAYL